MTDSTTSRRFRGLATRASGCGLVWLLSAMPLVWAQAARAEPDQTTQTAPQTATAARPNPGTVVERRLLDRVHFASGSAALSEQSRQTLEAIAAALREDAKLRLRVEGHTDRRGSRRTNMALSQRRAEAVRDYLVGGGIEEGRIETAAMGPDGPLVPGDAAEALAKNRRADLWVLSPEVDKQADAGTT